MTKKSKEPVSKLIGNRVDKEIWKKTYWYTKAASPLLRLFIGNWIQWRIVSRGIWNTCWNFLSCFSFWWGWYGQLNGGGFGGGLALLEFEYWYFLINIFCGNKFSLVFELLKLNLTTVSPVEKFFWPPPVVDEFCSCCFYRHNELYAWAWSSEGKQTETLQFDMCRTWIIQAMKWNNSAFVSTFSNRLQSVKSSIRYFVEIVACTHAHDITVAVMQQFRPFRLSWLCARSTQMFSGSYVMKKWRGV